jgi:hypothetical protein
MIVSAWPSWFEWVRSIRSASDKRIITGRASTTVLANKPNHHEAHEGHEDLETYGFFVIFAAFVVSVGSFSFYA